MGDQSHLRKTQWLVATSLTFGIHLKFGQDSCHTSKARPTFLPWVRKRAPNTSCEPYHYREGPPTGLASTRALPWWVVERRPNDSPTIRGLGVDKPEGTWMKIKLILFDLLQIRMRPSLYSNHLANFSNILASINKGCISEFSTLFHTLWLPSFWLFSSSIFPLMLKTF